MKVVDEKGKLFGKLNIIDLLVIILIIAALVVVGVKVLGGESNTNHEGVSTTKLTYTVRVANQRLEVAERLAEYVDAAEGKTDQLMAGGDMVDAYIVDYWTEPIRYKTINGDTMEIYDSEASEATGLVDICFVIEADVADTVTNLVGTQEVRVGKSHIVKTTHLEFAYGVIESCAWEPAA